MDKHTPGPWTEDRDDYDVKTGKHTGWIKGANGETVCEYAGCGSHEAHWPNPDDFGLALSAPELLEALRYAVDNPEFNSEQFDNIARAAIAKATGNSSASQPEPTK